MTLAFRRYEGRKKFRTIPRKFSVKTIAARSDVDRRLPRSSDLDLRGDRASARGVLCPQDLPQSRVVSVMDRGIEQRPWLGASQQRRHGGDHQVAIILVFGRGVGEAAFGGGDIDAAQGEDEFLERDTRESALLLAARYAGVLSIGIAFGQLTQFVAYGVNRKRDDLPVVGRNCRSKHEAEIVDLLEHGPGAVALIGPHAVAYRGEIGDQIAPIRRRQA